MSVLDFRHLRSALRLSTLAALISLQYQGAPLLITTKDVCNGTWASIKVFKTELYMVTPSMTSVMCSVTSFELSKPLLKLERQKSFHLRKEMFF